MSQLDVAIRADTTQQPAAIRLAARHLGGGTPPTSRVEVNARSPLTNAGGCCRGLVVEQRRDPAAALETAAAVLVRRAESLHHAVDGDHRGGW
jgi:hypothetical protein